MHSIIQRINGVSAFATTTLMVLMAAIAAVSLLTEPSVEPGRIDVSDVVVTWGTDNRDYYDRKPREWTNLRFDLQADLRPLFKYNTKQVFVYLVANYSTTTFPNNEVVVWDRIIRKSKDAKLNLSGARNKYAFKHIGGSFRNATATYTLHYNLMPKMGALTWGTAGSTLDPVPFPDVTAGRPIRRAPTSN